MLTSGPTGPAECALARLSAGTRARRAAGGEADRLVERIDWDVLAEMLDRRRLTALLGERIVALAGGRAPASFVQEMRQAIQIGAEQDGLLELISIQVIEALESGGIPSLPLKGPALGRALYGAPGRRPTGDIDLLVRAEDLDRAVEVATRLGYRGPAWHPPGRRLPLLHHRLVHPDPGLPLLELHWRVHWYEQRFSREMLLRSSPGGSLGRRPVPADELTSLLLFYARDGFVDLKLACDLGAWWDALGTQIAAGRGGRADRALSRARTRSARRRRSQRRRNRPAEARAAGRGTEAEAQRPPFHAAGQSGRAWPEGPATGRRAADRPAAHSPRRAPRRH